MKKVPAKRSKKGFTLIELVVVIAILGILAAILIPVIGGFIDRANEAADGANARNLYNSYAMALAVGDSVTTLSGTNGAEVDANVVGMFGTVPDGDSWSVTLTSEGGTTIVSSATYNGITYSR